MQFWVDAWDPSYAAGSADPDGEPTDQSTAQPDTEVEMPAAAWTPVPYPADVRAPDTVLLVDGVRRTDAVVWTTEPGGDSYPGLAVSYAAGVVRCDLRNGEAALTVPPTVRRGLFTASPTAADIAYGQVRYEVHRCRTADPAALSASVQGPLSRLEAEVTAGARSAAAEPDDLLVVDGPLRGRSDLVRAIGYVKTHQKRYLPPELVPVVTALAPGQRSPVFRLGTRWDCFTWYVRLPGWSGAPWSALVRAECATRLSVPEAIALADLSVVTLPRFAATSYKDPRAPQNLVPIAGLEQRLRSRLGDPRLLHRTLTRAAAGSAPA